MALKDELFGKNFGDVEKIGEGGFGNVFKVKDKRTGTLSAIKRIEIKSQLTEVMKEIRILSELKSDFVVNYIDSWNEIKTIDKQKVTYVYIQTELCSQNLKTFNDLINTSFDERFKTIKYFIRTKLLAEIIECLNHLHSSKPPIIHRDLKPDNVLVTNQTNGRLLKLCDFGLAKTYENSQNTGGVGTIEYRAPEVTTNDKVSGTIRYNLKSDIYSLGVIATKLFEIKDNIKKIRKVVEIKSKYSAYYSNTSLKEKFSKLLEIISIMVSKEPNERLSCSELMNKINEWTVDQNTVRCDDNYKEFIRIIENKDELKKLQSIF